MSNVNDWDEAAVVSWIESLGPEFKKHAAAFKANDINGRRLLKLTDEKLEKMGIASLGVRDDLVEAVQKLAKGEMPVFVPPAASSAPVASPAAPAAAAPAHVQPSSPPPVQSVASATTTAIPAAADNSSESRDPKKRALEAFVENAKHLLSVMKDGTPNDVVASSTNLIKSVRTVLDLPDLQGKMSDETRAAIVHTLGVLISNAKLVATGDQDAKYNMQSAVPTLIRSVNQVFTPQVAAQPQIRAQMAPPKPTIAPKPEGAPEVAPKAVALTLAPAPAAAAKPGPISPFMGSSNDLPSPTLKTGGSPAGSFRSPAPAAPQAVTIMETIVQLYTSITQVMQTIKGSHERQHLVDAIVRVITIVTKLLKETDTSGKIFVDVYNKRQAMVHHSTTIGQEVKAISDGRTGGEFQVLKAALKAISNANIELLTEYTRDYKQPVKCPVCSKPVTEDSILCEGENACNRWFHRECVGLYSGSFFHTGWTCGVPPCLAKLKEAERVEAEKKRVKEEALRQRQKEAQEIAAQKKKWEDDLIAKKKKEEELEIMAQEKAAKEREERLARIRNLDNESKRLEEEYQKMNQESVASTGLTLDQINTLSKWQKPANKGGEDEEAEPAEAPPVVKRERKETRMPSQNAAPADGAPVFNPPIPTVKSVRLSTLLDDTEDVEVICKAKAIYDYDPIGGDGQDLRFKSGDIINVIKKQKDGWWEGVLDGYVGFFYSSFVEEIADDGTSNQNRAPLTITHAPGMKKKAGGAGFEAPVPKINLGDLTDPDFDGWLWKEGNRKNWKRQWFVLKDFCLYFFENNKYDAPALGLVLIPGYVLTPYHDPKRENTFSCEHPSARTYYLAAEGKQDVTLWVDTLTRASQAKTWNEEQSAPDILKGSKKKPNKADAPNPNFDTPAPASGAVSDEPAKQPGKTALKEELKQAVSKEAQKEAPKDAPVSEVTEESRQEDQQAPAAAQAPSKPGRPAPKPKPKPVVALPSETNPTPPPQVSSPSPAAAPSPTLKPSKEALSLPVERAPKKGSVRGKSSLNIKVPVPNIAVKDLPNASHKGWLFKQGFSNKGWKKRWFVLEGFCLYYFETAKNDSKALGMVMLPSYNVVEIPTSVSNRSNCFDLEHPQARCYSFSAESEGEKEEWMEKLNAVASMT